MKACPYCAEDIKDTAIVCKHCGRDLPATATAIATLEAAAAPTQPTPAPAPKPTPTSSTASNLAYIAGALLIGVVTATAQAFDVTTAEGVGAVIGSSALGLIVGGILKLFSKAGESPALDVLGLTLVDGPSILQGRVLIGVLNQARRSFGMWEKKMETTYLVSVSVANSQLTYQNWRRECPPDTIPAKSYLFRTVQQIRLLIAANLPGLSIDFQVVPT